MKGCVMCWRTYPLSEFRIIRSKNRYVRASSWCNDCTRKYARLSYRKLKWQTFAEYSTQDYPICAKYGCGETDIDKLELDHLNGGGNEHKKLIKVFWGHFYSFLQKEGYPKFGDSITGSKYYPLQVLCQKHHREKERNI